MQSFPLNAVPVVAGTPTANALAGTPIQYWGKAGILTIYGNANSAGISWALTTNDGQENKSIVPVGSSLGVASTSGKVKTNEDFIGQFAIPAGVQLQLPLTNTGSGTIDANFLFAIT